MEALHFTLQKFSCKLAHKKPPQNLFKSKAWRTVMIVTSRNNHHKAYEVSGKWELLHDRKIGIILEMVTALKTKFMLRKKIPHDLFHRQHFQTTLAGAPREHKQVNTTDKAADYKESHGWSWTGSLQYGSTEPGNWSAWMRSPQTSTPLIEVQLIKVEFGYINKQD